VRSIEEPLPTVTASGNHHGLTVPPFVAELRGGGSVARGVDDPLATITAGGRHHGLTVPPGAEHAFYVKNHGGYAQPRDTVRSVGEPLGAITAKDPTSLVIPFRRGARPHRPQDRALSTVATREQHGLAQLAFDVDDCLFRMLTPEEHLAAQRFHPSYVVLGNQGERTMQAGNAVSSNVAQWLGAAVAAALCGDTASGGAA
jgi:DNA (cytosine-5)-methyltransferase 1